MRANLYTVMMMVAITVGACDDDGEDAALAAFEDELRGTWRSGCAPQPADAMGNVTWSQSELGNAGETGSFSYAIYGDDKCSFALARFDITSEPVVGALLPALGEDVRELDIHYSDVQATAFVDGFAAAFAGAGCGTGTWELGVAQSVAKTGCLSFAKIADCPADYDVARVDGDRLFNGVRAGDMCKPGGRPTALNEWFFARQSM